MENPKICIVHDPLTQYGGAEKTVEAISEIFPKAPIYTAAYKKSAMEKHFEKRGKIIVPKGVDSLFGVFPIFAKYFTFLTPLVYENIDLSEYNIIISSSSAYAKGVITKPTQLHISYIHTPPRFLYGYSVESVKRDRWYYKPVVSVVDHYLRMWDYLAAQRADEIVTNSHNTKRRIKKFYNRDATVIYPPVETKLNGKIKKNNMEKPYYVVLGRLAAYKNVDIVINAFNLTGLSLKVIGGGPEKSKLKKIAKKNIEFLGNVSDKKKHRVLEGSMGLLFPVVEEDFGIVPIEAMAHGKPVLAHKSGGAMESIIEGETGEFFDKTELEHLVKRFNRFDREITSGKYDSDKIRAHVRRFDKGRFKREFGNFVTNKWKKHIHNENSQN